MWGDCSRKRTNHSDWDESAAYRELERWQGDPPLEIEVERKMFNLKRCFYRWQRVKSVQDPKPNGSYSQSYSSRFEWCQTRKINSLILVISCLTSSIDQGKSKDR